MLELQQLLTDERMLLEKRLLAWGGNIFPYTSKIIKFLLSFGVLGVLLGSKYILKGVFGSLRFASFSPRPFDSLDVASIQMLSCAFDAKLLIRWSRTGVDVGAIGYVHPYHAFLSRIETIN